MSKKFTFLVLLLASFIASILYSKSISPLSPGYDTALPSSERHGTQGHIPTSNNTQSRDSLSELDAQQDHPSNTQEEHEKDISENRAEADSNTEHGTESKASTDPGEVDSTTTSTVSGTTEHDDSDQTEGETSAKADENDLNITHVSTIDGSKTGTSVPGTENENDERTESTSDQTESTDVRAESTDVRAETTDVRAETTDVRTETTDVQAETTDVQAEATGVQAKSAEKVTDSQYTQEQGKHPNSSRQSSIQTVINAGKRHNVVFIIADDLRPQISPYLGEDYPYPAYQRRVYTPNLEQLAAQSLVFQRAYVQLSACGPSRASMLTSRRPDTTRVNTNMLNWRKTGGNFTTLPQYFKQQGYAVVGSGKVFHGHKASKLSDYLSWTEPFFAVSRHAGFHDDTQAHKDYWMKVKDTERRDSPLSDDMALDYALERLRYLAPGARNGSQPFFLGFGIGKPHTPLVCPEKYFDLYPLEPKEDFLNNATFVGRKTTVDVDYLRYFRQAYYACITYVDELVGLILDEVNKLGLADNTIVTFISDHGFHLGENQRLGKFSNYELTNHVPMMLSLPDHRSGIIRTRAIVEALDLFPTLVEAAGLNGVPRCPEDNPHSVLLCVEGTSLLTLLDHPEHRIKDGALSQTQMRNNTNGDNYMYYSFRTEQFRYNEAAKLSHTVQDNGMYKVTMDWDVPWLARELYDHYKDPGEDKNVISDPEYTSVIKTLHKQLRSVVLDTRSDVIFDNSW